MSRSFPLVLPRPTIVAVVGVLLANVGVLAILRVSILDQVILLSEIAGLALAGSLIVGGLTKRSWLAPLSDRLTYWVLSFLVGTLVFVSVVFALLHRPVFQALGLSNPQVAVRVATVLLIPSALCGLVLRPRAPNGSAGERSGLLFAVVLATLLSATTNYGFRNNSDDFTIRDRLQRGASSSTIPNWGPQGDKSVHLIVTTEPMIQSGLPSGIQAHRGVQALMIGLSAPIRGGFPENIIKTSKVVELVFHLSFLYLFLVLCREVFNMDRKATVLVLAGAAFFAPINFPFNSVETSSYAGLFNASGTLYHNLPQLFSLTFALGGIVLIGRSIRAGHSGFAIGCALIAGSFVFKPALYTVLAPSACLLLMFLRDPFSRDRLAGYIVLSIPVAIWSGYRMVFHTETRTLNPIIRPFALFMKRGGLRFPEWVMQHTWVFGAIVLGLSFAAFLPALLSDLTSFIRKIRGSGAPGVRAWIQSHWLESFLMLSLVFGVLQRILLLENNSQMYSGNFGWAGAAMVLLSLPILVLRLTRSPSALVRTSGLALYALQLGYGVQHLIMVTYFAWY